MSVKEIGVLFVCTGNICRSPTAHGVMQALLKEQGLLSQIRIDSAGVSGYHVGERPDPRSQSAAKNRGYDLSKQRARKLQENDFTNFHYLIAMDRGHLQYMQKLFDADEREKLHLLMHFAPELGKDEVADPYYGPANGFERVLDDIEAGCRGLLHFIRQRHGI